MAGHGHRLLAIESVVGHWHGHRHGHRHGLLAIESVAGHGQGLLAIINIRDRT